MCPPRKASNNLILVLMCFTSLLLCSFLFVETADAATNYADLIASKAENEWNIAEDSGIYSGEKYIAADNGEPGEDWCADFASYCAEQAGMIKAGTWPERGSRDESITPYFCCRADELYRYFVELGKGISYKNDNTYIPQRGDIVFRYDSNNKMGHVGIVTKATKTEYTVIEGNKGNQLSKTGYSYKDKSFTHFIRTKLGNTLGLNISNAKLSMNPASKSMNYTGKKLKPKINLTCGGSSVPSSTYKVTYNKNKYPGTASLCAAGISPSSGKKTDKFNIKVDITSPKIEEVSPNQVSATINTYSNNSYNPSNLKLKYTVFVKTAGGKLVNSFKTNNLSKMKSKKLTKLNPDTNYKTYTTVETSKINGKKYTRTSNSVKFKTKSQSSLITSDANDYSYSRKTKRLLINVKSVSKLESKVQSIKFYVLQRSTNKIISEKRIVLINSNSFNKEYVLNTKGINLTNRYDETYDYTLVVCPSHLENGKTVFEKSSVRHNFRIIDSNT